jgi:dihydrofolate synthase/folylpolyglutamate synthase
LYARQPRGIRLGLDRMRRLLAALEDPHDAFLGFHVAGTNGKGSTAAFIEAALRFEGYRTGLYLSPHVSAFAERIHTGGRPVAPRAVVDDVEAVRDAVESMERASDAPTFFEIVTAMAFHRFRRDRVEVAAVEVGLGGRHDATNLVRPLVSVITPIALDHTDRLGTQVADVAGEKAGIIRPGVPVVTAAQGVAAGVVERTAKQGSAPLTRVRAREARVLREDLEYTVFEADAWGRRRTFQLSMLGRHQALNALVAVRALERATRFRVLPEAAMQGLHTVRLPGRLEAFGTPTRFLVDGAHNPRAMATLVRFLQRSGIDSPPLVLGVMREKDLDGILRALAPLAPRILATRVPGTPRSRDPDEIVTAAERLGMPAASAGAPEDALERLREASHPRPGVVTGSLYLAGHVRRILGGAKAEPIERPVYQ